MSYLKPPSLWENLKVIAKRKVKGKESIEDIALDIHLLALGTLITVNEMMREYLELENEARKELNKAIAIHISVRKPHE